MLIEWLSWLEATTLAGALRASRHAYPLVNALHIIALGTLFGAIAALDLRLLGFFSRALPAGPLAVYLPRVAGGGLAIAVLSGVALFCVKPLDYIENRAFLFKVSLVALGTLHALALHRTPAWRRLLLLNTGGQERVGGAVKLSAALSLAIWSSAIVCGRFIAF